jgi:hypothetical protein
LPLWDRFQLRLRLRVLNHSLSLGPYLSALLLRPVPIFCIDNGLPLAAAASSKKRVKALRKRFIRLQWCWIDCKQSLAFAPLNEALTHRHIGRDKTKIALFPNLRLRRCCLRLFVKTWPAARSMFSQRTNGTRNPLAGAVSPRSAFS